MKILLLFIIIVFTVCKYTESNLKSFQVEFERAQNSTVHYDRID